MERSAAAVVRLSRNDNDGRRKNRSSSCRHEIIETGARACAGRRYIVPRACCSDGGGGAPPFCFAFFPARRVTWRCDVPVVRPMARLAGACSRVRCSLVMEKA